MGNSGCVLAACALAVVAATLTSCADHDTPSAPPHYFEREQLLDPDTCGGCHSDHYREWAGSMHAYASQDPVFLAMNRRGQEETSGALGGFCVSCHAPLALREGATTDGLNLADVPKQLQGVNCYFCHNADAVLGTHDNPLRLSGDVTLRGGIADPRSNPAHASEYSELFSSPQVASASLCGSCHDVTVPSPPGPAELHLERTFEQWQGSIFSPPQAADDTAALSCNGCHMLPTTGVPIADGLGADAPLRSRHAHSFAGVDVAFGSFPNTGDAELDQASSQQQEADLQRLLDSTLRLEVCVLKRFTGDASLKVTLDNATAGHHFPTGAAQDRRAFVEVRAFAAGADAPFYESGVLPDGTAVTNLDDPDLWLLRDRLYDADGAEVHQFWQAAELREGTLPVATSLDPLSPGFVAGHGLRQFPSQGQLQQVPERVTVRVRLEPIGREVLDDLVASGHLDAAVAQAAQVLDLLPNRHLGSAAAAPPELQTLGQVSFEWGPATREHGNFRRTMQTTTLGVEECIGMPGRPVQR
jgi:Cytochrome c554 and c-prime